MANVNVAKKTEQLLAPARALNELALANAEQLMDLQLANTRKYATLVLDGLKQASTVTDAEGARSYLVGRAEAARTAGESLRGDTEALLKMGQDYVANVQKVVEASVADMPKFAA